ncbi:MAG: purine-cytosine permease family protein [Planctomycetota bacterium]|jgi:purine-cytosine permease-like protein
MDTEKQSQQTQAGSEFEREPVPKSARLGFKSFVGMYAGEHCAGTELMLGPLFVAAGVGAYDLIMGLLLGNALAVLSWMFLCAPIATRTRLTLYYQLEKICGRKLVTLYNLANGVMFCFLAGAMVTVSATAAGVCFKFPMPGLNDLYPNSVGWVVAVAVVGGLIAVVAAYGYQTVAKFANIAAPWMVLVFLAFGFVGLRQFIAATGAEVASLGDAWELAKTHIWKGGDPQEGQVKFTFWHVTFFAWFCNMAMHIGMSDLSVFRFAKKSWYGVASSTGMYVGHFMAWISASILYAYQLHLDPADTLAYRAAGLAGLVCVIVAGWTTANPTIYRAGLAFQAIVPKSSRFKVTLITGAIATIAGMFPAIAMQLLGFVALYGLILMPMGAVIFVDFWLIRKFGLESSYAELSRRTFNWAAGLAWFLTFAICLVLVKFGWIIDKLVGWGIFTMSDRLQWIKDTFTVQIFFVSLPGWFMAAILYVVLSKFYQRKIRPALGQ